MVKIDRKLNLVIPIERDDGSEIYVHAAPISREVFEGNFLLISKTFGALYAEGLGVVAGPRIAAMMLRKVADDMGQSENAARLLAEIRRLANVVVPGVSGWETLPLQDALDHKMIDATDAGEVLNALVFFTLISAMHRRSILESIATEAAKLWGARIEQSSATVFASSLPRLTATASSGVTAAVSSLPS